MLYTNEAIKTRKNKIAKIKSIIATAVYIILIPLLIYNVFIIATSLIKPDKTPSVFGIKTYVIISGSMMPELEIGDIVVVKTVLPEELKVGDLISYRKGQVIVTHRITKIVDSSDNKKEFITKGDSNNVEDSGNVSENSIEGKVIKKIPKLGNIAIIFKNKTIIITIIILYYIYLVRSQSKQKKRNIRKLKRQEYEISKINNIQEKNNEE